MGCDSHRLAHSDRLQLVVDFVGASTSRPAQDREQRQVVLPKDVLTAANLQPGDFLYVQANDDPPGTIVLIPVEMATTWFEDGRESSRRRALEQ